MERSHRVLILGDPYGMGFEPLASSHSARSREDEALVLTTPDDAASHLDSGDWHPDLVVVVQRYPEEFAPSAVHRLISLAPLARWIVCLGPWCESAGRNGIAWPLALCVPARSAGQRLRTELDRLRSIRPPLPLTASRDEAFEHDLPAQLVGRGPTSVPRISIASPDAAIAGLIESVCRKCSADVVPPGSSSEAVDVHIADVDPLFDSDFDDRFGRQARFPPDSSAHHWIAVTGSVAPEDAAALRAAGALAVIPKLSLVAELPHALALP